MHALKLTHKAHSVSTSRLTARVKCFPAMWNDLVKSVSSSDVLARCLFLDTNSLFLKLLFPHICFVCIWSLMIIGYFSLFASLNLSPRCEGHVSFTLVFQSLRGLYSVATVYSALCLGWHHKVLKRVYSLKKQNAVMVSISSWQVKDWEKMVANHLCDKGIVSRICKSENKQLN